MKSKPVEYLPAALLEFEESAAWYEEHQPGVGERFQEAVKATERQLQRDPMLGTSYYRQTRKWRMKGFPFNIVYREESERIIVVAVAHGKRRPGYWHRRLS